MSARRALPVIALVAVLAGACGKEAPKVDAAAERKEALDRAKQGPFGTLVQAVETAKGMEADLNKKATDMIDKAEQGAK
jgi:hypothetical protein